MDRDIMIVDDTPEHIDMAVNILSPLGYPIRACADSEAALRLMGERRPAVLLLDIQMPGMSGFELLRRLGEDPGLREVAVLMVSVSGEEEDIRRGFQLGARDYVTKPYLASELLARVKTHMQLVAQQRELAASYDELEQFCHTVSHDLKAPLLVIRQLADLLMDEVTEPEALEICARLCDKTEGVTAMIDRLLELSKVTSIQDRKTPVDLDALVREVFDEQTAVCPDRVIRLEAGELPTVDGEPSLLYLLFQNVIGNAVKFTRGRGEAVIRVGHRVEEGRLVVMVRDNGIGFDMQYAHRLFQIFERLHGDAYPGSGVGLAIVDRIMRRHGGRCGIEAEPGKGCEVSLYFPVFP